MTMIGGSAGEVATEIVVIAMTETIKGSDIREGKQKTDYYGGMKQSMIVNLEKNTVATVKKSLRLD
jgi:hypothetical protein